MTHVTRMIMIHAPADAIWQVISDLRAACDYLAGVGNCTVEGAGVGALRTLTSVDGSTVVERLDALDEAAHRLSYALLTDTPFGNCLTMMAVRDLGLRQAALYALATLDEPSQAQVHQETFCVTKVVKNKRTNEIKIHLGEVPNVNHWNRKKEYLTK